MNPGYEKKPKALVLRGMVPETRQRTCLRCGKPFKSRGYRRVTDGAWNGNYLCATCNKTNSAIHPLPVVRIPTF